MAEPYIIEALTKSCEEYRAQLAAKGALLRVAEKALTAFVEYRFLCSDMPGNTGRLDAALIQAEDLAWPALAAIRRALTGSK